MPKFDDIKKKRDFDTSKYDNFDPADPENFSEPSYSVPHLPYSKITNSGRSLAKKIRHQKVNFGLNFSWRALLILISILSISAFGLVRGTAAKNNLDRLTVDAKGHLNESFSLIEAGDLSSAMLEADQAKEDLLKIKLLAQSWGQDIVYLRLASASNSKMVASERLLDASYSVINIISEINKQFSKMSFDGSTGTTEKGSIFFNIKENQKILIKAIDDGENRLAKAKDELLSAKKGLDKDSGLEVDNAISAIDDALQKIGDSKIIFDKDLTWLSGADGQEKNILIIFQNNAELRGASGGSLGSFGIAKFKDGNLTGVDFGTNIYKLDHAFLAKQKIPVPDQLNWIVQDGLGMKDSGWDIDGPAAMEKIMWFYEQETGNQIDGTIMLDSSAFVSLLMEVGPIDIAEMGKTINASNFRSEIEYEVHKGYFESTENMTENEPKKILAVMMPKFTDKLFSSLKDKNTSPAILSSLSKSLKQKDITLYFKNTDFENRLKNLNYSAAINSALGDYFYITNSNIDGAKSSHAVQETVKLDAIISDSGNIKNTLILTRKHNGSNDWPDGMNKNFVRLALPENSKIENFNPVEGYFEQFFDRGLKDGKPFWLTSEFGRNILNFWMTTKPQEESKVEISYSSDYSVNTGGDFYYAINFQKQTGAPIDDIELTLNYPNGFTPENVKNYDDSKNQIILKFKLDQDKMIKIRFKKSS